MGFVQTSLFVTSFVVLANCNIIYNMSLIPEECLTGKAISGDYTPLGKMINVGNISVYEYEAPDIVNKKRMLIAVYDIYGLLYPNLKHVADQMAIQNGGFRTILPDFFRGDGWTPERNTSERDAWLTSVGDWDTIVMPDLINLVRHYKTEGFEEFAIYGMCWGGRIATQAAQNLSDIFKASALIHPSMVDSPDAEYVKIPMYLMPTLSEPDLMPFYEVLQNKFGNNSGLRLFEDVSHGFTGARSNFSDPLIQMRVNEVITKLGVFFDHNLNGTSGSSSSNIQSGHLFIYHGTYHVRFLRYPTTVTLFKMNNFN